MVETLCEFRRLLLNSWWVCRTRGSLKLGKLGWKVAQPRRISVDDSKGGNEIANCQTFSRTRSGALNP